MSTGHWDFYRPLLEAEYIKRLQMEKERTRKKILWKRFKMSAKLNWNRNHAPTPAHLLRLKKPILPNRWINFREGWSKECWGFTNADLTPYMIEKAAADMMEAFAQPTYKEVIGAITMPEGFKLPEVDE